MSETLLQGPELYPKPIFDEFVFKLASGCNQQPLPRSERLTPLQLLIGCNYCYEYSESDAWQDEPAKMSPEVIAQGAARIAEHARANGLNEVRIIAHGGEPLMLSAAELDEFATIVRSTIQSEKCKVHLSIQTNGLMLTDEKIKVLEKHGFVVGLSMDGGYAEAHDRNRRDRGGHGTFERVIRAAERLRASKLDWGIISIIDTVNDPVETIEALGSFGAKAISMFPKHANHKSPPEYQPGSLRVGAWQEVVFDRYANWSKWHAGQDKPAFSLAITDAYLEAFYGALPTHERIGNRYTQELFITPSGKWQRLDTIKSTQRGAVETGLNIFDHSLDYVGAHDAGIIARRMRDAGLAAACLSCIFKEQCAGEYYPNRFSEPTESLGLHSKVENFADTFRNPSVYCGDQIRYLGRMARYIEDNDPAVESGQLSGMAGEDGLWQVEADTTPVRKRYASSNLTESCPPDLLSSMLALEASTPMYGGFPLPLGGSCPKPALSSQSAKFLAERLSAGTATGRSALHGLSVLHEQFGSGRRVFFQGLTTENPRLRTLVQAPQNSWDHTSLQYASQEPNGELAVTDDIDDVVMRSVFHPAQPFLQELAYKVKRQGKYWLITANAVRACKAAQNDGQTPHTNYVVPFSLHESLASPGDDGGWRVNGHTEESIWPLPAIRVDLDDAPGDLLVVDVPGDTAGAAIEALDKIADMLQTAENPEQIQSTLEQQGASITLRPLCSTWPSVLYGSNWKTGEWPKNPPKLLPVDTAPMYDALSVGKRPISLELMRLRLGSRALLDRAAN